MSVGNERSQSRLIDAASSDHFRDVVVILQPSGAQLHRDHVVRFGDSNRLSTELNGQSALNDGIGVFVLANVNLRAFGHLRTSRIGDKVHVFRESRPAVAATPPTNA
jgi:hypothetical protein